MGGIGSFAKDKEMKKILVVIIALAFSNQVLAASNSYNCKSTSQDFLKLGASDEAQNKIDTEFTLNVVPYDNELGMDDERIGTTRLIDDGRSGATRIGVTLYETEKNGPVNIQMDVLTEVKRSVTWSTGEEVVSSLKYNGSYILTSSQVRKGIGLLNFRSIGSNTLYQVVCVKK